jgi:hypothetical protein
MRILRFMKMDSSDFILRGAGAALAAASLAFAYQELSALNEAPRIAGIEHLAIYARPSSRVAQIEKRDERPGIDYTPVGATRRRAPGAVLGAYEIIEASPEAALIRLPEGRILRVAPGDRIAGLGDVLSIRQTSEKWIVNTQSGAIRQD